MQGGRRIAQDGPAAHVEAFDDAHQLGRAKQDRKLVSMIGMSRCMIQERPKPKPVALGLKIHRTGTCWAASRCCRSSLPLNRVQDPAITEHPMLPSLMECSR